MTPLELQYRDVACWQRRRIEDAVLSQPAREYWRRQLSKSLPQWDIPLDGPLREAAAGSSGFSFVVEGVIARQLEHLGVAANTSLFVVLLAALNLALSRVSGQTEFLVGLLGAGRDHEATQEIVGFFVNTLAYRCRVEPGISFERFLRQVNGEVLDMVEHQWYPLEKVIEELDIPFPEIRVLFNMFNQQYGDDVETSGFYRLMDGEVKFPLIFYANRHPERLVIRCHFRNHLFSRETIDYIMTHYRRILSAVVEAPDKTIKDILFPKRKKRLSLKGSG